MLDLSFIIVSYQVRDLLQKCLTSLFAQTEDISFEVTVVDNNSSDGSVALVREDFPRVKIIENKENIGFARANNLALSGCKGRYILLLNPDTVVPGGLFQEMVRFMDEHSDAGGATPKIVGPDGYTQHTHLAEDTFPRRYLIYKTCAFFSGIFAGYLKSQRRHIFLWDSYSRISRVGFIAGTCFIVSRKAIETDGFLDEKFFIYAEDTDLSLRIRKKGYHLYLLPYLSITHHGQASWSGISWKREVALNESLFLFLKKNYGFVRAFLYRTIIVTGNVKSLWCASSKYGLKKLFAAMSVREELNYRQTITISTQLILWGLKLKKTYGKYHSSYA